MNVDVVDNQSEERYEAQVDGKVAGAAFYELRPGRIVFVHTEVDPAYEGHGIGSALAKNALDDARSKDLHVIARCPFIAHYIEAHPGYRDLLAGGR